MYTDEHAEQLKNRTGEPWQPSNGFEGNMFMSAWCSKCIHNTDPEGEEGCEILLFSMVYSPSENEYPKEWIIASDGQPCCTAFARDKQHQRCTKTLDIFGNN